MIEGLYKIFNHWHSEGTTLIFSDPHFDDAEIEAAYPNRPKGIELVHHLNRQIGKKDRVIILGDVGNIEMARLLKGYKILIAGNHDTGLSAYEGIFNEIYSGPLMVGEKLLLSHEPVSIDWAFNIHGHDHTGLSFQDKCHYNVALDCRNYIATNFNKWMKEGHLKPVRPLHRETIDLAADRKRRRKKGK